MYHIMPWQTNNIFFILLSQHLAQCQNSVADALRARAQRCTVLYPLQILADGSTALFLKVLQQLLGNAGCALAVGDDARHHHSADQCAAGAPMQPMPAA